MSIVASGEISIISLNDARQLVSFIGASSSKTVIYTPDDDVYVPNYGVVNQVLSPQLFVAGMSQNIINQSDSIKWFYQENSFGELNEITENNSVYEINSDHELLIKSNILSENRTVNFICEIMYEDDGILFPAKAEIELVKVTNGQKGADGEQGESAVFASIWTPNGNIIKNGEGTIDANIRLFEGSSIVTPSLFKWYIQDPTSTVNNGGDIDGGNGWRRLTSSYNASVTGYNTDTITVPSDAIISIESFKSVVEYQNKKYQDTIALMDITDPHTISIVGSNIFKNGRGSSQFTARVYRNGEEIDINGNNLHYKWYMYDENDEVVIGFYKEGKVISVNANEINTTANLICEVITFN